MKNISLPLIIGAVMCVASILFGEVRDYQSFGRLSYFKTGSTANGS